MMRDILPSEVRTLRSRLGVPLMMVQEFLRSPLFYSACAVAEFSSPEEE
jgi:hypothetical protein